MAVGWGALMAGIALVVVADTPGRINLSIAAVLTVLAGFLSGVRSEDRRVLHAALGAIAGLAFYVVFVLITWVVSIFGGPDRAGFSTACVLRAISVRAAAPGDYFLKSWWARLAVGPACPWYLPL